MKADLIAKLSSAYVEKRLRPVRGNIGNEAIKLKVQLAHLACKWHLY